MRCPRVPGFSRCSSAAFIRAASCAYVVMVIAGCGTSDYNALVKESRARSLERSRKKAITSAIKLPLLGKSMGNDKDPLECVKEGEWHRPVSKTGLSDIVVDVLFPEPPSFEYRDVNFAPTWAINSRAATSQTNFYIAKIDNPDGGNPVRFAASNCQLKNVVEISDEEEFFKEMKNEFVKTWKTNLDSDVDPNVDPKKVTVLGYPSSQFEIEQDVHGTKIKAVVRMVLAGRRFYSLCVVGAETDIKPKDVNLFFNSLAPVNDAERRSNDANDDVDDMSKDNKTPKPSP